MRCKWVWGVFLQSRTLESVSHKRTDEIGSVQNVHHPPPPFCTPKSGPLLDSHLDSFLDPPFLHPVKKKITAWQMLGTLCERKWWFSSSCVERLRCRASFKICIAIQFPLYWIHSTVKARFQYIRNNTAHQSLLIICLCLLSKVWIIFFKQTFRSTVCLMPLIGESLDFRF